MTAGLFSPCGFYSSAAALPEKLKTVHKKTFLADESTFEDFLSAQMPRTKTFLLSAKASFLCTMSLFSQDLSDRKGTLATRAKGRSQRLVSVVYIYVLPQQEILNWEKRTEAVRQ